MPEQMATPPRPEKPRQRRVIFPFGTPRLAGGLTAPFLRCRARPCLKVLPDWDIEELRRQERRIRLIERDAAISARSAGGPPIVTKSSSPQQGSGRPRKGRSDHP